jgi:hypothetical protein
MIEGCGSVSLTNGSRFGSGRPKTHGSYGSGSAILVKILKLFDADPGLKKQIRNPGWKNSDSG